MKVSITQITGVLFALFVLGSQPLLSEPLEQSEGFLESYKGAAKTVYKAPKGQPYRVFHLEFSSVEAARKYKGPKNMVFNRTGRFVDTFATPDDESLQKLASIPGLIWLDYNRTVRIPPPPSQPSQVGATRAGADPVISGGIDRYKGRGVTIALIDSGFDVRHPDFQIVTPSGRKISRFRALWDTAETRQNLGQPGPIAYPDGRPIGVIYTREYLNNYLNTPPAQRPQITWDKGGHGTACAGIAAGNGQALEKPKYVGVAPEADLIGIRLGDDAQNTWLVTALLKWLDDYAGEKPLVISNSWGGQRSGHDGNLLIERQIDARFPADRPGRLVLFAAGNEGEKALHAGLDYGGKGEPAVLELPKTSKKDDVELTLYFDSSDKSINIEPKVRRAYLHALSNQWVAKLSPKAGLESLKVWSSKGNKGHVDVYISGKIAGEDAVFKEESAEFQELVNNPGNAENVLTVGSYDFNPFFLAKGKRYILGVGGDNVPMAVGDISSYSSPGYTRTGRLKPDLTAPGQWWTATAPVGKSEVIRDTTGHYRLFNGTSAATPYTAGVMALFLEKRPTLCLAQVRKLLDQNLKEDLYTGPLPNPEWGRGKLDTRAILEIFEEL